jgi:hypothetical protein
MKIINNSYKILKKVSLYIKKSFIFVSKALSSFRKMIGITYSRYILKYIKQIAIGFLSLILAVGLGYGIYKYFTTPRAPNIKAAGGGYLYKAKGMDFTAFIGSKANNRPDINFAVGSGSVVFTPASGNENPDKPETDGNKTVIFKNVYENIDFKYKTIPLGIKEDIMIRKPTPIRTFPFFLDFKDVTPQYITDNIKGTAFFDKDGNYLFNFEKPYAIDANGARTDNLGLLIQKDAATGRYVAIVTLDDSWMNDPKRTYPITVDPTIVHDTTSEFATGGLNRVVDNGANAVPVLTTNHQEVPADIHTVGLWHMNETSGNALDSSGNVYTGTPTGTTIVSGQNGYGKARSFNGAGDYIALGDIMNGIPLPVTIEAWTYQSELCTGTCTIFHSDDPDTDAGNYYGFSLATGSGNNLGAAFYNGVSAGPDGRRSFSSSNGVLPTGRWNHVAVVISGIYDASFYVNGQLVPTTAISGTATTMVHNSNPAKIGRNTRYGLTYFNGIIDEVRVSDIARTPEEIASNALNGRYSTYTSPAIDMTTVQSWSPLTWTGSGFTTGSGETATASATSNLVAQWNFNETSGTTAAVATGSCGATCNGTLTNFASTGSQDAAAKTGWTASNRRWGAGALMFDGTNDYVTTGYQWNSSQAFTIEAWVNPASETAGDWQKVIASNRGTGTPPYFDLYMGTGTTYTDFGFAVWNDAYTTSWIVATGGQNDNGMKDKAGKWHHVVAVYYPNDKIQIYVDGEFKKEVTGLSGFSATGSAMSFGIHSTAYGANTRWFDGTLDTSRVYNKALSASEILSNFNLGQVELQTRVGNTSNPNDGTWEEWRPVTSETAIDSLNGPYQYNTTDAGLTHYWPMDEASGTSVADVKGANGGTATGTLVNNGKFGRARGLNGTSDYVSIGNVGATQGTAYTVEFWAKKDTATSIPAVYSENTPASWSNNLFIIYYGDSSGTYNGGIRVWYRDGAGTGGSIITYPTNVADGKWHHVAFVQSATNSRTLYLDGVVIGTDTVAKNALSVTNAYIGAANNNSTMQQFFNGSLDEMRTYSSALSASTVQQHFIEGSANANTIAPSTNTNIKIDGTGSEEIHLGQTPVDAYTAGLWHMDETTGTGAYIKDSSGNGNHGTPTGATLVEGYSSKARSFNGTSSYIEVTSSTSLQVTSTFTLEAWVKRNTDATGTERLLSKSDTSGYDYWLQILDDSTLQCGNTKADTSSTYRASSTTVPVGKWTLVTCTFDAAVGFNLYINGVLSNGTQVGTLGATRTSTRNFQIARLGSTSWYYTFNGVMDEVRVSNIARPAGQIAETYRAGQNYRLGKVIPSVNLGTTANKLPFYVASDRLGTYSQLTIGNTPFANYEPDTSTASLWQLDDEPQQIIATGGTITDIGGYRIHTFTGSGTFTANSNMNVEVLVVAGGGAGGVGANSGGGGAGGLIYQASHALTSAAYSVTVGNGGQTANSNGQNSVFSSLTAVGGGGGGLYTNGNGASGGSGGGGGSNGGTSSGGAGTAGQGNAGGGAAAWYAGGGGGAGGAGESGVGNTDGTGGIGLAYSISGSSVVYAAGGNSSSVTPGGNGAANTGNGGSGQQSGSNYLGGSGIVIIRYPINIFKDTSGNYNNVTLMGSPRSTQGKIGQAKSLNGTSDYLVATNSLNYTSGAFTISMWVNPVSLSNSPVIVSNGAYQAGGYYCHMQSTGAVVCYTNQAGAVQGTTSATNFTTGTWQHLAIVRNGASIRIYRNGQDITVSPGTHTNPASTTEKFTIGTYGAAPAGWYYNGSVDEVRVDSTARTADDIRQAYEVGLRTHDITIDFKATLIEESIFGDTITSSSDLFFLVDETAYGSSLRANHIFPGEKIIVKENLDGIEYIAQGTVAAADPVNGFITVTSWDSGSTFPPSGGYTSYATAFKWQREYFDITGAFAVHRSAVTRITYRITDGSTGANIWLDDVRSSQGYLSNAQGSTITSSTGRRYAQYRAIIAQHTPANISPTLTTVVMNYTGNSAPNTPSLNIPSDGSIMYSTVPFRTTATDPDSNTIRYKIVLCTTSEMTTGCQTFDQNASQIGWSEQNADGGTSYTSGSQGAYTVQSALSPGTTYFWKSYAIDPSGSNTWSTTQTTPYSFTKVGYPTEPTNLLTMGLVNPNDVKTLTPYFSAIYNSSFNVVASHYQLQVSSSPDFSGGLMWDSGQVVATGIAPGQTHPNITYAGSALSWNGTYYWRIKFWNVYGNAGPYSQVAPFSLDSVSTSCRIQETSGDTSLTVVWKCSAPSMEQHLQFFIPVLPPIHNRTLITLFLPVTLTSTKLHLTTPVPFMIIGVQQKL